jgi:hypothetical protein
VRGRRVSGEGLLTVDGIVANTVVEASMTKERFLHFLEHQVVSCNLFPGPCSTSLCLTILDAIDGTLSRKVKCSYHGQCKDTSRI